jgi:hypothetical protein
MKKRSVMVVIHSENEESFEGHIVAVLFKPQRKTQIFAVFLSPKLLPSKVEQLGAAKKGSVQRIRIRMGLTKK